MPFPRKLLLTAATLALLAPTACHNYAMPTYPDGYREFAYVANGTGNSVSILDLVLLRPEKTLHTGIDPLAIAASPTRDEVYALNADPNGPAGTLTVIDTLTNTIADTLPVRRDPTALTIAPNGLRAYIADTASNAISVLDLAARRTLATVPAGQSPSAAQIAPDNRTLVVANATPGTVALFTPTPTGLTLRNTYTGCPGATSPVILPDSTQAFIACSAGHQVLSLALAQPPDSYNAKQNPTLTQDHVLALLDVGQNPTHLTLKPDGGEVFASNLTSDSVSEISTYTNEVSSTYAIGNRPTHGLVSRDDALWIAASGADSLSLYSIDDGRFISSLRTGSTPDALAFSADQHLLLAADSHSGDVAVIRTQTKLGPALLTILPAGGTPLAIAIKAMPAKP